MCEANSNVNIVTNKNSPSSTDIAFCLSFGCFCFSSQTNKNCLLLYYSRSNTRISSFFNGEFDISPKLISVLQSLDEIIIRCEFNKSNYNCLRKCLISNSIPIMFCSVCIMFRHSIFLKSMSCMS